MRFHRRGLPSFVPLGVLVGTLAACATESPVLTAALDVITAGDLAAHTEVLSSDAFEGRGPSSPGEERTIEYLRDQFQALGLQPGNGDSWYQEVPLVAITATAASLAFDVGNRRTTMMFGSDFVTWTKRVTDRVDVRNAGVVFVGYGIVAPEYGWNDYEGVDARGKTVIILVNDPGFATQDTALFTGNAMTYYGRWTYKFEEAARQGAAAALVVHETDAAGYGWNVVQQSWSGEQFDLVRGDDNMSRVAVEGWMTLDRAGDLFLAAGLDFDRLKTRAATREFRAVPLNATATASVRNTVRRSMSHNVVALLPGAAHVDEHIVYMGHWDHFGVDPTLEGDQIFNGALDNATGTAGLLVLAKAFEALEERPERSILFLAVTAEEQGLLGSAYYASHPVVPLAKTVAAVNLDALNILGPMRDITVVGLGFSELDDYLAEAVRSQGRRIRPDPEPEKGFYYRSDHFSFAKAGVPALYVDAGIDHVEHGEQWTRERRDEYSARHYHQPSDEYDPAWDLSGAVQDLRLVFRVGYALANERAFPNWREGTEFRAARDAMMGGGAR